MALSRLGISPKAEQLADRAFRARMNYTVRIERMGPDGVLNEGTGLLEPVDRFTVYEGIGGVFPKGASSGYLADAGSVPLATTTAIIPRSARRPRDGDLLTILTGPDSADRELGLTFTVSGVDGAGRLGALWRFSLTTLEPNSDWDVTS